MARYASLLAVVAASACVPPQQTLLVRVQHAGAPVEGAVVVLTCPPRTYAQLTDADGRATVRVGNEAAASCSVLAGRPGHATVQGAPSSFCRRRACPPLTLDTRAEGEAP